MATTTVERPNGVFPKAGEQPKPPTKRELAKQMRDAERERKREDRERAKQWKRTQREEARKEKVYARKCARAVATDRRKARCVILPQKAKITQAISKDESRPVLRHALITREGRGDKARWVLVATDSYQLMVLPLEVTDPKAIRKAIIGPEALKAIEHAGAFRMGRGKLIPITVTHKQKKVGGTGHWTQEQDPDDYVPAVWYDGIDVEPSGVTYDLHPESKPPFRFADYKQLVPKEPAKSRQFQVTFNATLLRQLATAMGQSGKDGKVTLAFDLGKADRRDDGVRACRSPFVVRATVGEGVLMPIRDDGLDPYGAIARGVPANEVRT